MPMYLWRLLQSVETLEASGPHSAPGWH